MQFIRTLFEIMTVIAGVACPPIAWALIRKADAHDDLKEAWLG